MNSVEWLDRESGPPVPAARPDDEVDERVAGLKRNLFLMRRRPVWEKAMTLCH